MTETPEKYIDLEASIRKSKSDFLKKLPRFIIRWLEILIKQDLMNDFLWRYRDCKGSEFHKNVADELNIKFEISGLENLPESGHCFFVANHPFGVLDGLTLTKIVLDKYGDLRAIGNDAFMLVPNLRPYIAQVNVYGRTARESVEELEKIYASDLPITHFPAGLVSRKIKGVVQDSEWQKSFINKAVSCRRDVVPFHFHGQNSRLFYSVNKIRSIVGMKMNLELALLPSEFFKKRNATVKVTIGKPISWQEFNNSRGATEWAQEVRRKVYELN
jgi:putative hemolysin